MLDRNRTTALHSVQSFELFLGKIYLFVWLNFFFRTFLHPFELPGIHLSSIVGMNGNMFESVNNGPKLPFWEAEFISYSEKCLTLRLRSVFFPQTIYKISGWFYAKKMVTKALLVLYSTKWFHSSTQLVRAVCCCCFPGLASVLGRERKEEACIYLCNNIYVDSFYQS